MPEFTQVAKLSEMNSTNSLKRKIEKTVRGAAKDKNPEHSRLVRKDEHSFLHRRIYSGRWNEVSEEQVHAAFNAVFQGQEFEINKAAISLDLYFEPLEEHQDIQATPPQRNA